VGEQTLVLVPSPLVGPATWGSVATWLSEQGHRAVVVETGRPRRPDDVVSSVLDVAHQLAPVVLVPHSNAGLLAPCLSARLDVVATVFVDAALARSGPDTALAPPALLEKLRGLAAPDGMLPPWSRWWDDLSGVFPSAEVRTEIERQQPRLPLSYFTSTVPVPVGWAEAPCAYLAFGDTYANETAFARAHGWPVSVLPGRHLQMLHDPAAVGAEILRLSSLA
jgi:hypothetical protein